MNKDTQKARILRLLRRRMWVSLPDILDLRIANYTSVISELRDAGYEVRNELKFDRKKKCYVSRYTLEG